MNQKQLLLEIWGEHRKQYPPKQKEKDTLTFTPSGGNSRPKHRKAKQKRRDDVGGTPFNTDASASKGLLPGSRRERGRVVQNTQLILFNHEKNTNQSTKDGPQRASINYGDIESDNGLEQLKTLHCHPMEEAAKKARKTNGNKANRT